MDNMKQVAVSKYAAMAKARQTVFLAVMSASMIVSAVGVTMYFIWQNIAFNFKVIDEQTKSMRSLDESLENLEIVKKEAGSLQAEMVADTEISAMHGTRGGSILRLIVDALPTEPNSTSVGQSIQKDIIGDLQVSLVGMNVDTVSADALDSGVDAVVVDGSQDASGDPYAEDQVSSRAQSIGFSFSVAVKAPEEGGALPLNNFTTILQRMERSIRAFRVDNYKIEYEDEGATMTIEGRAFYMPSNGLTLKNKTVSSSDNSSASTNTTGVSQ